MIILGLLYFYPFFIAVRGHSSFRMKRITFIKLSLHILWLDKGLLSALTSRIGKQWTHILNSVFSSFYTLKGLYFGEPWGWCERNKLISNFSNVCRTWDVSDFWIIKLAAYAYIVPCGHLMFQQTRRGFHCLRHYYWGRFSLFTYITDHASTVLVLIRAVFSHTSTNQWHCRQSTIPSWFKLEDESGCVEFWPCLGPLISSLSVFLADPEKLVSLSRMSPNISLKSAPKIAS